jgi:glycosyltransferase involved in cell wall biosynthesis
MTALLRSVRRAGARCLEAAALWRALRFERRSLRHRPIAELITDQTSAADAVRWLGEVEIAGVKRPALFCHPVSQVTYRLRARAGDRVTTSCALLPEVWDRNTGGVEFTVTVTSGSSGPLARRSMVANPGARRRDRRWRDLTVRVPRTAGQGDIAVTFATRVPSGATSAHAWAIWGDPAIEAPRPRSEVVTTLRTAGGAMAHAGPRAAVRELRRACTTDENSASYRLWFDRQAPSAADLARMASESERLPFRPLISIITPVYNTDPDLLRACIDSVRRQAYPNWELCLADDGSTSAGTLAVLREQTDPRIRVTRLETNARISAASNAALALATGEFIALLDHDDELTPNALFEVVTHLNSAPATDVVYSDEDKLDPDGRCSEPFFKPDWSPEHLLTAMYTCHLTVARRSLVERIGGFRIGYEGAQDHDLMLRLSDVTSNIHHLPRVLYHWRRTPESTASAASAKPWADDSGRRALADYVARHDIDAEVVSGGVPGLYRVRFAIRGEPRVTVLVVGPPDGAERLRARTAYPNVALAAVDRTSADRVAAIDAAAARADGDHLLFVDASLAPVDDQWLTALLEFSQQPHIGAVGARLEYADGRLRHIGLVTCTDCGPSAVLHGHAGTTYGHFSSAIGVRNYSAVSGECLMTRRDVFERLGGFDPRLPWIGADVDYCVRVRQAALRIVSTPYARLRVPEAVTAARSYVDATRALRDKWGAALDRDPYYNVNFTRASADYELPSGRPSP